MLGYRVEENFDLAKEQRRVNRFSPPGDPPLMPEISF
jgi:hypothetical protein